ncbi:MAG: OB-fold nucleic acid binding domain-containing protein [Nanoarchaeota archaeon]
MALKDLQPKQGNVDVVVTLTEKGDVREFQKFGKSGRVCSAKVKDDSGDMVLTLWNDEIDQVNIGDKIHLTSGYVSEWQGEMQLSAGRYGKIEVLGKDGEAPKKELKEPESAEEEPVE